MLPPNAVYVTKPAEAKTFLNVVGDWQLTASYNPPVGAFSADFGGEAFRIELKRVVISLLLGVTTRLLLVFLPRLAIRLFPYRDLPIVGERFERRWIQEFAFYVTNSLVYAVAALCMIALIRAASRRT